LEEEGEKWEKTYGAVKVYIAGGKGENRSRTRKSSAKGGGARGRGYFFAGVVKGIRETKVGNLGILRSCGRKGGRRIVAAEICSLTDGNGTIGWRGGRGEKAGVVGCKLLSAIRPEKRGEGLKEEEARANIVVRDRLRA